MNEQYVESFLNELGITNTPGHKKLVMNLGDKYEKFDVVYRKIHALVEKIKKYKGFVSISNSKEMLKIDYDGSVLDNVSKKEFYRLCEKWAAKNKLNLEYDPEKDLYYILYK